MRASSVGTFPSAILFFSHALVLSWQRSQHPKIGGGSCDSRSAFAGAGEAAMPATAVAPGMLEHGSTGGPAPPPPGGNRDGTFTLPSALSAPMVAERDIGTPAVTASRARQAVTLRVRLNIFVYLFLSLRYSGSLSSRSPLWDWCAVPIDRVEPKIAPPEWSKKGKKPLDFHGKNPQIHRNDCGRRARWRWRGWR